MLLNIYFTFNTPVSEDIFVTRQTKNSPVKEKKRWLIKSSCLWSFNSLILICKLGSKQRLLEKKTTVNSNMNEVYVLTIKAGIHMRTKPCVNLY